MTDPIETTELLAFVRTIDAKSLSRAAAELRIPRATIGRRLARLEERLGVRLVRRSTRTLALTDAGETFYRHARLVLEAVAQAESSVRSDHEAMRGDVRVSIPPIVDESLSALITAFATKHPGVRVQIDVSTRHVDLRRDGYDVALRAAGSIEPGLVARTIARYRVIAVASPGYLATYGTPRSVRDLKQHRCLTAFARGELPQSEWPVGRGVLHVDSSFSSNDLGLLRAAALAGLGIARLPTLVLGDLLDAGTLVQVLPGVFESDSRLAVVYVERELLPLHVRAFVDALMQWSPPEPQPTKATKPSGARPRA